MVMISRDIVRVSFQRPTPAPFAGAKIGKPGALSVLFLQKLFRRWRSFRTAFSQPTHDNRSHVTERRGSVRAPGASRGSPAEYASCSDL